MTSYSSHKERDAHISKNETFECQMLLFLRRRYCPLSNLSFYRIEAPKEVIVKWEIDGNGSKKLRHKLENQDSNSFLLY